MSLHARMKSLIRVYWVGTYVSRHSVICWPILSSSVVWVSFIQPSHPLYKLPISFVLIIREVHGAYFKIIIVQNPRTLVFHCLLFLYAHFLSIWLFLTLNLTLNHYLPFVIATCWMQFRTLLWCTSYCCVSMMMWELIWCKKQRTNQLLVDKTEDKSHMIAT